MLPNIKRLKNHLAYFANKFNNKGELSFEIFLTNLGADKMGFEVL